MGKGGKGKSKGGSGEAVDDDALLDAAIAENKKLSEQQQAAQEQGAAAGSSGEASTAQAAAAAPPAAALTKEQIIQKLNAVPTFCILKGHENMVGLQDPTDPTGQCEVCVWFADPTEAKTTLAAAKEANADVRSQLHLGVTPLGVAFELAVGWKESKSTAALRLQSSARAGKSASPPPKAAPSG